MSAAQHTQGLLKAFNLYAHPEIRDQDDGFVATTKDDKPRSVADARRLVACWNACDGITTERLEDLGRPLMKHLIGCDERAARMVKERDELLAALEDARNYIEATTINASSPKTRQNYGGCLNRIDDALAKVKGGAA